MMEDGEAMYIGLKFGQVDCHISYVILKSSVHTSVCVFVDFSY